MFSFAAPDVLATCLRCEMSNLRPADRIGWCSLQPQYAHTGGRRSPQPDVHLFKNICCKKTCAKKTKKIIEVSVSCHCSRFVSVQRQTQSFLCNCRPPGCARRMLIVLVQDCKTMFTVPVAFLHSQSLAHALQSCSAKPTCFCRLPAAMGLQVIL